MFSGNYQIEEEEGSGAFLDRDGSVFHHVLAYLRDGVVAVGCERDIPMLERLKREFDFYCIEPMTERTVVLAVGGRTPYHVTLSSVEAYDVERRLWQASAPMLQERWGFGMCVIAGELYVTGGGDSNDNEFATVERYSPSSNTWSSVTAMPEARYGHEACEVAGSMYGVGGSLQQTWKYDAEADSWSEVAPLPDERLDPAACSIGSDIFVIGGRTTRHMAQSDVHKYNSVSNTWSTVSPMPTARKLHGACVVGGMIYVAGGLDTADTELSSVLRYDPSSDTWTAVASMFASSSWCSCVCSGRVRVRCWRS